MDNSYNYDVFNLGCGGGYSVLEVITEFGKLMNKPLKFTIGGRREGDMARLVAVTSKAEKVLGWKAVKGLKEMC